MAITIPPNRKPGTDIAPVQRMTSARTMAARRAYRQAEILRTVKQPMPTRRASF